MSTFSMIFSFDSPRLSSLKWKTTQMKDLGISTLTGFFWECFRSHSLKV
jgi:hypothetical protein